jgi:hypothetical protein
VGNLFRTYGPGAITVTSWASYTPTLTHNSGGATNVTITGKWRRVADTIQVRVALSFTGTPANFDGVYLSFPSVTIDTTKLASSGNQVLGEAMVWNDDVTQHNVAATIYASTSTVEVRWLMSQGTNSPSIYKVVAQNSPIVLTTNDLITSTFSVPISGW